ncbi:MAG: DUF460 domain-containing protein [Candidatus Micrarchaeia archaeon]
MHIIVGIDGGKTAAIACIDLNAKVLKLFTGRFVSTSWFVNKINETGEPVIIASDKEKPDDIAKKLAAIFGAVLFSPDTDISTEKKAMLAGKTDNLHERDALAAAKLAYNAYANKLKQVDKLASKKGVDPDRIKALVIAKRYSAYEALNNKKSGRAR